MQKLGKKIKKRREELNMKANKLANQSEVSPGYISQLESGKVTPSVSTLKRIADALNTPIGNFFEDQNTIEGSEEVKHTEKGNSAEVVHKNERKILSPADGVKFYLLTPDLDRKIEFILNVFEPGASTGEETYSHPGEEVGVILRGELVVIVEGEEYICEEGDSITFDSSDEHRKVNRREVSSVSIWANSPPWF